MCLYLDSDTVQPLIAQEDITVYKYLVKATKATLNINDLSSLHGRKFKGVIKHRNCEGTISCESDFRVHFCTDDRFLDGNYCVERFGYKYSWELDFQVNSIIVDDVELLMLKDVLTTPFRDSLIEINALYRSQIKKYNDTIEEGLHSIQNLSDVYSIRTPSSVIVECIIPKGSLYYVGTFRKCVSYASDALKYVKIIGK